MTLINAENRSKLLVFFAMGLCIGLAILLGVAIFELPWSSNKPEIKSYSTLDQALNHSKVRLLLENLEKNTSLSYSEKAEILLQIFPVIDGHNDLPWNIRNLLRNNLNQFNFSADLTEIEPWASYNESFTDIPRLRQGQVGAQFWVAYANCASQGKDALIQTLEQIDVIHQLIQDYNETLKFCDSAKCILETSFNPNRNKSNKIASLIGVEGGHLIQNSVGVLRQLYKLGVRYLTLTHVCNTAWADASPVDDPKKNVPALSNGLSDWGLELIDEMNRIGMMVDISHVSEATMIAALKRSKAPVIFSHSGAKAVCDVHRNVGDNVLKMLKANGGIIMINFYSEFVYCEPGIDRRAVLLDVVKHIENIRDLIGVDHIGLGGDYDGVDSMPRGLEDVSKYPHLFATLVKRGWKLDELRKLSFTNIIRVMEKVEQVRDELQSQGGRPMYSIILEDELLKKNLSVGYLSDKSLARLEKESLAKERQKNERSVMGDQPVDDKTVEVKATTEAIEKEVTEITPSTGKPEVTSVYIPDKASDTTIVPVSSTGTMRPTKRNVSSSVEVEEYLDTVSF